MSVFMGRGKIRFRLISGFVVAFASMAMFGAVSYYYFVRMEQKLVFMSQADELLNTILESRRYEKNYFLYRHEKDFEQALAYLKDYERILTAERAHIEAHWGGYQWLGLKGLADDYGRQFSRVQSLLQSGQPADDRAGRMIERLRGTAKRLIDQTELIAREERRNISSLLRRYRPLLAAFLVLLAGIGAWLTHFLIVRLVQPLQVIEAATEVVAQGKHAGIPWRDRREDEIESLVHSFNRMVDQLHRNNEQMIQTEKLTALGTLTSGVAHELNNPLNNISTSCQILLEELDQGVSGYHRELLTAIDEQVAKARDIVSSLLEFARQREFELRPEDLKAVVMEAVKLVRGEVPAGVEIVVDVPAAVVLNLDKAHLVQALLNLIMNGIQAMPDGGRIVIRGWVEAEQGRVALEVEDSGQGIDPQDLPRIFDPFFTTKEVGRGTGLGLAITYGIVERHQGRIQAQSLAGRGAKFKLTLPLVDGREG